MPLFANLSLHAMLAGLCLVIGVPTRAAAMQNAPPQTADIVKERFSWTTFPELTAKGVSAIAQDSSGNLWFGIEAGILRYDGRQWRHYMTWNGLPAAAPQSIKTGGGALYSLYESEGIFVLSDTLWRPVDARTFDAITFNNILPIGCDSLWAAADRGALLICPDSTHLLAPKGVTSFKRGEPASWPEQGFDVYDIYQDREGNLWFISTAGDNEQLVLIPRWRTNWRDRAQWKVFSPSQKGHPLGLRPKLFQAFDGSYWIYTYSEEVGLIHFNNPAGKWSYIDLTQWGGNNVVLSVCETRDRVIWFGGNGYLYAYRNDRIDVYRPDELHLPIAGLDLLQTRDGALWIAAMNVAVYRIDYTGQNWCVYDDLHYQCRVGDRRYFLSVDGKVVQQVGGSLWSGSGVKDGLMDMPVVVLTDSLGGLWAAGSHRGVAAVSRLSGKRWQTDTFPDLSWSIGHLSALVDREGRIWFGSIGDPSGAFRGGCVVYQPQTNGLTIHRFISNTESFNRINSLAMTRDGRVWAGASYLLSWQGGDWQAVAEPKELQRGWIDHVMGASDGSLWASKGGVGVFRLRDGRSQRFSTENGLAGNMATFLLEIPDGMIAATERGISRFDSSVWSPYCLPREIILPRESGTLRYDSDGTIWINLAPRDWYFRALKLDRGTDTKGFRCLSYRGDRLPPRTKILVYQSRLATPANPYIAWQGHDAWGATPQEDLMYSYRLDDGEWSPYSSATFVQLLDIPAGRRQFSVRARDRDGNIEAEPAQITFEIIPPIWKQPWFLAAVVLFSVIIFGLLVALSIKNNKLAAAKREIEKAASFKERFYLNLSHEFRTPLTMILALIAKLSESDGAIQLGRPLAVMRRHAHYLLRLVNQLLEFRKIESGAAHLQVAETDLVAAVGQIKRSFDWLAKEHRLTYRFHSELETLSAFFDMEKVETILTNLIGNAFKYTHDGGKITVTLAARSLGRSVSGDAETLALDRAEGPFQWAEITVADTGVGIPPERLEHIFERFYTVEHPGRLYYDSIGVGLDLTRELVDLHKGVIRVESIEERGTTFTVLFPVDRRLFTEDEMASTAAGPSPARPAPEIIEEIREERRKRGLPAGQQENRAADGEAATILIVEDHPDLRGLMAELLEPNYTVLQAEDGEAGVALAEARLPDLIISDIMMPKLDGIALTQHLKNQTLTSHIPIILLTVKKDMEHRIEGLDIGADQYLSKPFEVAELFAVIRNLIAGRKKLQQKFRQEIIVQPTEVTINDVDAEFLATCIRIVENHIGDQDFHVDQFCRELGMSRTPAFQKIKSISGFTPNEFILHIRLKRAAQLLADSTMNISEIAYSLGFSDHAHFTRHFRDAFGCPPKEFRKRQA